MPNPILIPNLVAMLTGYPTSPRVSNAYSSPFLVQNLVEYFNALLSYPYSGDLMVAEAPGHAGCARTGIPLTSEYVIAFNPHPFIALIRPRLVCSGTQTESTATMVWACLSRGSKLPAFWNTFPFHPHHVGNLRGNRKPNAVETRFGVNVLDLVIRILTPQRVFALGRVAESILSRHFAHLAAPYIRHPSNGGNPDFVSGMIANKVTA
jgi:hypothetical protein